MYKSKETWKDLATEPERFEFIFSRKHGSCLNTIESLFTRKAKTFLPGVRIETEVELKQGIQKGINELIENPVVLRREYGLESNEAA